MIGRFVEDVAVIAKRVSDQHVVIIGRTDPTRCVGDIAPGAIHEPGPLVAGDDDLCQCPSDPLTKLILAPQCDVPPSVRFVTLDKHVALTGVVTIGGDHLLGQRLMRTDRSVKLIIDPLAQRPSLAHLANPQRQLFDIVQRRAERCPVQKLGGPNPGLHHPGVFLGIDDERSGVGNLRVDSNPSAEHHRHRRHRNAGDRSTGMSRVVRSIDLPEPKILPMHHRRNPSQPEKKRRGERIIPCHRRCYSDPAPAASGQLVAPKLPPQRDKSQPFFRSKDDSEPTMVQTRSLPIPKSQQNPATIADPTTNQTQQISEGPGGGRGRGGEGPKTDSAATKPPNPFPPPTVSTTSATRLDLNKSAAPPSPARGWAIP